MQKCLLFSCKRAFIIMKNAHLIPKWRIKIHGNKRGIKTQGGVGPMHLQTP
jgi:hypothetical protein